MKQNVAPWLGVSLPYTLYSRLLTGISILAVFQNLRGGIQIKKYLSCCPMHTQLN